MLLIAENRYIEDQPRLGGLLFGSKYDFAYGGCSVIAVYNAMVSLGEQVSKQTLLTITEELQRRGVALGGKFGVAPISLKRYLRRKGYAVRSLAGTNVAAINALGDESDTILAVVFGGIQRVAHVSSVVVPVMAVGYFVLAVVVIVMNIQLIPHVLAVIVKSAFGLEQAVGGTLGAAIMNGVKRGLFSNEAGEGSAPNAAATAAVSHPVKQGLIQALGVFTDTLVVCSCTAFIILISGLYTSPELNGIMLTQAALQSEVGSWGPVFVAVAIFLFAYSSMIGNYYYGEANVRFMTKSRTAMTTYRLLSGGVMVMFGAWTTLEMVWSMIDLCMALLTACNLVAIALLGKYVFRLLDDYRSQKRQGIKEPTFQRDKLPEIAGDIECWE